MSIHFPAIFRHLHISILHYYKNIHIMYIHTYIHSILSNQYSNELPCIEVYIHSYVHAYCVVQHNSSTQGECLWIWQHFKTGLSLMRQLWQSLVCFFHSHLLSNVDPNLPTYDAKWFYNFWLRLYVEYTYVRMCT